MRGVGSAVLAQSNDLVGNWDWTVWLLIPLVLGLALVTALALGPLGEPSPSARRERGVSRYLARAPSIDEEAP